MAPTLLSQIYEVDFHLQWVGTSVDHDPHGLSRGGGGA